MLSQSDVHGQLVISCLKYFLNFIAVNFLLNDGHHRLCFFYTILFIVNKTNGSIYVHITTSSGVENIHHPVWTVVFSTVMAVSVIAEIPNTNWKPIVRSLDFFFTPSFEFSPLAIK